MMRRILAMISVACLSTPAIAESHVADGGGFGVTYASEDCNNDPGYLTANDILCTAVFSDTNVWDFLDGLPRRISLEELADLNPGLGPIDYETVIGGITFVRVR